MEEQGGASVCSGLTEAPSQSSSFRLSLTSDCCVFVVCVCGLVENRVFPSEVSVRGSARSHWQSTAMLN